VSEKKTLSEPVLTRITPEQREALERIAATEYRSVAAVVRRAIRELLEREREQEEAAA